jgi:DNA sulfur modification protein DndD
MLFIGDNGDGKTTFFEALEWLFDTTSTKDENPLLISAKQLSELSVGELATLRVSMLFEHDGEKLIEKSYSFSNDGSNIKISDFRFSGFENSGLQRIPISGKVLLERCFDTAIRKYCLFKGESELNVFDNREAMKLLLEKFSNIRDFEPYISFTEYGKSFSNTALQNQFKKDKKIQREISDINNQIYGFTEELKKTKAILQNKENEAAKYTGFISDIEKNAKISSELKTINDRLESLNKKKEEIGLLINENYTVQLLDDMWILCIFSTIFKEFQEKTNAFSREKRKLEDEDKTKKGKEEAYQEISKSFKEGIVPLSIYIPDENTMKEMIEDEFCKVCGREAKQGTDAYNFMVDKLNELLKSQQPKTQKEEEPLFSNNYAKELEQNSISLGYNQEELNNLIDKIRETIKNNETKKTELKKVEENIDQINEDKIKLLAQSDNLSENELLNQYQNISNWVKIKGGAEKDIPLLKEKKNKFEIKLSELQDQVKAITKDTQVNIYVKIHEALDKINDAFLSAKNKNTDEFFELLEKKSNEYLEKLNIEDFRGIIKLTQTPVSDGEISAKIELYDNQERLIHNPNTALKTTMYMSVLFGISYITTIKRENDYPLIFDAPTSSFSDAKESTFFNVISKIKKQCIIFTKSFLIEDKKLGKNILNEKQVESLNGSIYRIEKKRPFNEKDLSTIQTLITPVK